jgi:hypothetical protein
MIRKLFLITSLSLFCLNCGGSKTTKGANDANLPDWVMNPVKEAGYLFGVGIAEQSSPQLAIETADLRAKKEIAKALSQRVSNLMKDFISQAGIGTTAEQSEFVQSITKSITDIELNGCTIEKRENKDGKYFSLAKFPLDLGMRNMVQSLIQSTFSGHDAMRSAFEAKQGFDELDRALQKNE